MLSLRVLDPRCPGISGASRDVPDLEAVLGARAPGPRYVRISKDVPGPRCPGIPPRTSWDVTDLETVLSP